MRRILLLCFPLLSLTLAQSEEPISPEHLDYFEKNVRPALVKYCYECHSVESGDSRGGLFLDTREAMREGGSSGPIFDDENWEYSLFVDAITWNDPDYEMPPKNKMPDDVIAALVEWVKMGAPDPRVRETFEVEDTGIDIEAGREHWSYQLPVRPAEKSVDEIIAGMQAETGVTPVEQADALNLIRRLTFDLTGLPPTPPEVVAFSKAFQADREAAIAQKVDQLLASKHFGERWGRHWLDVVRYGESSGTLNIVYPYAWRFRNYVIDSFNEDKPYDELILEHLAGDLLPASHDEERQENLIATGFLAVGPKKQNEKNRQVFAMNLVDEQIDTTTRAFLGTTVSCARCHDHKFDPIPTSDYYAMAGIFKSTETLWGTIAGNQNHRTSELLPLPVPDKGLSEDQSGAYERKLQEIADLKARNRDLRTRAGGGKGKGKDREEGEGSRTDAEMMAEAGIDRRDLVQIRQRIMRAESELEFLNPDGSEKTFAMGAREGTAEDVEILVAGDINKPAGVVERGFPQVLHFTGMPEIPADSSGRLELAQWITSTRNPLTARVMVNRIWLHLTGSPIVETMDNFGTTGLAPTSQELLDFLAIRFMESGWSVKSLIREIVLSDTYQLASTYHIGNYEKDPANTAHWRAKTRQLDAEALRDQMLLVSGLLDRTRPESSMAYEAGNSRLGGRRGEGDDTFNTALFRGRSLYLPILRDALPDELGLFDFPDPQGTVGQRSPTNVAPQSLHLMNSELVQVQAEAMADLLQNRFPEVRDQVSNAFLLSYNRAATPLEIERSLQFLREFDPGTAPVVEHVALPGPGGRDTSGTKSKGKKGGKRKATTTTPSPIEPISPEKAKLAALCQALMMSAEFRTIH
ncbi:MAG: PSD1 and planctomycete cytochrome C domain-containing protein [Verrucomicrobiota bacterium]